MVNRFTTTPSEKRQFKNALFEQFAKIGKGLAAPQRLEILELLAQDEKSVDTLASLMGMPIANTSQHLQVLRRAELVSTRRQGTQIYYQLSDPAVFRLWQAMRDLGEARLAAIDRVVHSYFSDRSEFEVISAAELTRKLQEENVTVLDVRPGTEYAAGHIAGARSIPIEDLELRLGELPKHTPMVAYCRGPYCVFADEAVQLLKSKGFTALRLDIGLPDWASQGLPTENASQQAS